MQFASFSSGTFEAWNKKDRPITLKRLWKSFITIWTTWYNLRKRVVEYAYKLTAIHVKNTYQICQYGYLFSSWMSRFFREKRWLQFREGSVVSRRIALIGWQSYVVSFFWALIGTDFSIVTCTLIVTYTFWPHIIAMDHLAQAQ